ncbi:MAG TPA: LysM peptidoglycan-binding domain-containing protein [Jiangellales bacterium]|nr:LysM peptidoglycan-binding domain-containing protein [Jiangellales bacterium]
MAEAYGIELRHPLQGDLVGHTLTLAAIGTAFEATYGWRLLAGGTAVADGHFQAGSMGTMEAFVHQEAISFSHLGPATLQVFGDDPSGEHPPGVDLVEVPVILVPGMTGYQIHTVVRGDTLSKLARDYGSTVQEIAVANGIVNPDLITVGQVLRIPV